jgi:hypothetical protein
MGVVCWSGAALLSTQLCVLHGLSCVFIQGAVNQPSHRPFMYASCHWVSLLWLCRRRRRRRRRRRWLLLARGGSAPGSLSLICLGLEVLHDALDRHLAQIVAHQQDALHLRHRQQLAVEVRNLVDPMHAQQRHHLRDITGAGGDYGVAQLWNRRGISVSSDCDQSHYLHPHPYHRWIDLCSRYSDGR